MPGQELSHHERVRVALEHQETDRVPISMICSGIHRPTYGELESMLQKEHGIGISDYLRPILDVIPVYPSYIGPALEGGTDHWEVRRRKINPGVFARDPGRHAREEHSRHVRCCH